MEPAAFFDKTQLLDILTILSHDAQRNNAVRVSASNSIGAVEIETASWEERNAYNSVRRRFCVIVFRVLLQHAGIGAK
jgi:hypothetical protein